MVVATESIWDAFAEELVIEHDDATVYGDYEQQQVLHRGTVRVLPNGWVAIPTGRLLSPDAVHHIDP